MRPSYSSMRASAMSSAFDALRCDDCLARTEARAVGRELVSREFRGDCRSLPIDDRLQDGQRGQLVEGGITLTVAIFLITRRLSEDHHEPGVIHALDREPHERDIIELRIRIAVRSLRRHDAHEFERLQRSSRIVEQRGSTAAAVGGGDLPRRRWRLIFDLKDGDRRIIPRLAEGDCGGIIRGSVRRVNPTILLAHVAPTTRRAKAIFRGPSGEASAVSEGHCNVDVIAVGNPNDRVGKRRLTCAAGHRGNSCCHANRHHLAGEPTAIVFLNLDVVPSVPLPPTGQGDDVGAASRADGGGDRQVKKGIDPIGDMRGDISR